MTIATIEHIVIDSDGNAKIKGSRIKVIHLVMAKEANNWSVENLIEEYPHLGPAAIYAAFAYYYDHKEEMEQKIEEYDKYSEEMASKNANSPLRKKLLAAKE